MAHDTLNRMEINIIFFVQWCALHTVQYNDDGSFSHVEKCKSIK